MPAKRTIIKILEFFSFLRRPEPTRCRLHLCEPTRCRLHLCTLPSPRAGEPTKLGFLPVEPLQQPIAPYGLHFVLSPVLDESKNEQSPMPALREALNETKPTEPNMVAQFSALGKQRQVDQVQCEVKMVWEKKQSSLSSQTPASKDGKEADISQIQLTRHPGPQMADTRRPASNSRPASC